MTKSSPFYTSWSMQPLVSILIPAYNVEAWIRDTLESALAQTWPRKEIIVVDDGSTDRTLSIAQQFASRNVTVVSQPNQGAAAARNKAYSLCQGGYIQWLDGDDLLAPDKISRQMDALAGGSGRLLLSSAFGKFMYRADRARFNPSRLWSDLSPVEWTLRKFEDNAHMQTSTWLISRELTDAAGAWDPRLWVDDDGEYFARVIKASEGIRFVPEAKVFYRITGSSRLSHIGRSSKKMDAQFFSMRQQIDCLRSLDDTPRARAACVNYLQTWMIHFYPNRPDIVERARELAKTLGGELHPPVLPWKYAWLRRLCGWSVAKGANLFYNQCKSSALRSWDKAMFLLKNRRTAGSI